MLPTEDALWVADGAHAPLRRLALAVRAHGDRRQPLRDPARAARDRAAEGPRLQLVLPRHGRRDVRDARGRASSCARSGNLGPPVTPAETTKVVEWNDVDGARARARAGDVALVLTEPALTNIGIVHPEPGFHDALRALTRDTARCSRSTRRTRSAAAPAGTPRRTGSSPTSSRSASRSPAASRRRRTGSPTSWPTRLAGVDRARGRRRRRRRRNARRRTRSRSPRCGRRSARC